MSSCHTWTNSETRWERGEASIAQEHFASSVLRGRLLGLARGWGLGFGPVALLACLPGEQHDLGLIAFGLALRARGWRIVYLGSDTPIETIEETSRPARPQPHRPERGHRRERAAPRHAVAWPRQPPPTGARRRWRPERRKRGERRARPHRRPDRRSNQCHDANPGRRSAMRTGPCPEPARVPTPRRPRIRAIAADVTQARSTCRALESAAVA